MFFFLTKGKILNNYLVANFYLNFDILFGQNIIHAIFLFYISKLTEILVIEGLRFKLSFSDDAEGIPSSYVDFISGN
jgi:hypothetical protein